MRDKLYIIGACTSADAEKIKKFARESKSNEDYDPHIYKSIDQAIKQGKK
jgi:hypothetical protein